MIYAKYVKRILDFLLSLCGIIVPVSYTHLRAHETKANLVCRLLLEKNFFNDTATTEIYTY